MQIAIGSIPVALVIYAFIFSRNTGGGTRGGLALITIVSLLILVFTTLWFYRYIRLAKRIADPERRPSEFVVQRAAWTCVAASTLGIVFSMLIMLLEVAQLLFYFLRAPQGAFLWSRPRGADRQAGYPPPIS